MPGAPLQPRLERRNTSAQSNTPRRRRTAPGPGHRQSVPGRRAFAKGCAFRVRRYARRMARSRFAEQADLFDRGTGGVGAVGESEAEAADFAELVERVRRELRATLARVQGADVLPWPDLTVTYLAELRFDSISGWLPGDEARALKQAFGTEMERLYHAAGEERPAGPAP